MAKKVPPPRNIPQSRVSGPSLPAPPTRVSREFNAGDAGGQMLKQAMRDQTVEHMRKSMEGTYNNGNRGR